MSKSGFTLVEIMIVVAIIGLLAAIAIPNFVTSRKKALAKTCIGNLRQIFNAKTQCAWHAGAAAVYDTESLIQYLKPGAIPSCPAGGTYDLKAEDEMPTCTLADQGHICE